MIKIDLDLLALKYNRIISIIKIIENYIECYYKIEDKKNKELNDELKLEIIIKEIQSNYLKLEEIILSKDDECIPYENIRHLNVIYSRIQNLEYKLNRLISVNWNLTNSFSLKIHSLDYEYYKYELYNFFQLNLFFYKIGLIKCTPHHLYFSKMEYDELLLLKKELEKKISLTNKIQNIFRKYTVANIYPAFWFGGLFVGIHLIEGILPIIAKIFKIDFQFNLDSMTNIFIFYLIVFIIVILPVNLIYILKLIEWLIFKSQYELKVIEYQYITYYIDHEFNSGNGKKEEYQ